MRSNINLVFVLLFSIIIVSCKNENKISETNNETKKVTESQDTKTDFSGDYVSDDYSKRNDGYDWVALSVNKMNDSVYNISVRSRADKKKPSCTFDAIAAPSGNNILKASVDGLGVLFTLNGSVINISAENENDIDKLKFYCSGGATFEGDYTKISEPLDRSQIDPRIFQKFLTFQDISFDVSSTGDGSIQKLSVKPAGLSIDNEEVIMDIDGSVTNAEIADLNSDGFPELLVYTTSAGSGSYGNVIGFSVNNGKSMSQIFFPPVSENPTAKIGYMGHDEFEVVETSLVQRFPVYKEGDTNSNPTGNIRQITYKLVDGEASRKFVVEKIVEIIPE